ncbi:MAG: DUF5915 domain-containing protein, partial [Planctomycetota bacterium]
QQCQFTDRIVIEIAADDASLREAVEAYRDFIASETLALEILLHSNTQLDGADIIELADVPVAIRISVRTHGR